jgi:hypothetical protein
MGKAVAQKDAPGHQRRPGQQGEAEGFAQDYKGHQDRADRDEIDEETGPGSADGLKALVVPEKSQTVPNIAR